MHFRAATNGFAVVDVEVYKFSGGGEVPMLQPVISSWNDRDIIKMRSGHLLANGDRENARFSRDHWSNGQLQSVCILTYSYSK